LHNWNFKKKGHGFCRHGLKKIKAMGAFFDLPMAVLVVYATLPKSPQQRADQCKISIKPITIYIVICS
jgi:hypothetical protein